MSDEKDTAGVSTEPGAAFMDKLQEKEQKTVTTTPQNVEIDKDALEILEPSIDQEPTQVEDSTVIFIPQKDFEARINKDIMVFRTDVPTKVSRDVANMLVEDKSRGYIRK